LAPQGPDLRLPGPRRGASNGKADRLRRDHLRPTRFNRGGIRALAGGFYGRATSACSSVRRCGADGTAGRATRHCLRTGLERDRAVLVGKWGLLHVKRRLRAREDARGGRFLCTVRAPAHDLSRERQERAKSPHNPLPIRPGGDRRHPSPRRSTLPRPLRDRNQRAAATAAGVPPLCGRSPAVVRILRTALYSPG
jgi:hypothetical protein